MEAGRLRHRVVIEQRVITKGATGDEVITWATWKDNVPAEILPLSAKEYVVGSGIASQVTARITIRWREGLDPTMRIKHRVGEGTASTYQIYNIAGLLPDNKTGREYITIPVTRGVNEGG